MDRLSPGARSNRYQAQALVPGLRRIHGALLAVNHVAMKSVFDVRLLVAAIPQRMRVGFVFGEQQRQAGRRSVEVIGAQRLVLDLR